MKLRCFLIAFMLALILNTNFIESVDSSNIKTDSTKTTNTKSETNEKKQFSESNEPQSIVSYEAHSHVIPPNGSHSRFNLYTQGLIEGEAKDELLTSGPVYWEGWGKYFHYDEQKFEAKPKDFFENNEFYHQKVLKRDYLKKDKKGYLNIPTKFHFYFSINENNVRVLSSRNRKLLKVVDTMHIDLIHPIPLDDLEAGGVKDLGEFDEGNCIQVLTSEPLNGPNPAFKVHNTEGMENDWVFCLDTINEKEILLKTLTKIKTLKQKARGDLLVLDTRKPSISKYLSPKPTPNIERYTGQGANKYKDGFWVLLQDWSACTLKCGGGVQHQQWLCQPPLPGGMPCQGSSIRKRPCNLQACPEVLVNGERKKTADIEVVKKPIIKSLPWSSRLQRYIQCEVKESDILYIKTDVPNQIGKKIKFPGRLVMTNRTLSMYEDDSFKHSIFTFNLQDTTFASYEKDSCCFFALSMDKKFRICGFGDVCGTKADPKFVKEWSRDFNLFQQKCYVDLPKKDWKEDLKRAEEDEDHGKIEVEQEKSLAREFLIKRNLKEKEDVEIQKKIVTTQEVALRAIRKELKLERLIKTEEKLKEKERLKNLLNLKAKEEKKQECLERALKAREEESMKGRDSVMAEKEIAKIKEDAKKEVEQERAALRVKLNEYKKKSGRRQMQIEYDINLIRSKMASNLLLANKNGDMLICKNSLPDPEKISKYCNANFIDNYKKNQDCKDMENFCDICCSNEFGNIYLNKRDECFNLCDESIGGEMKGDWIWTKEGFKGSK